jgi:hypothetical protein
MVDIALLEAASSRWEFWGYIAIGAVFVGVIGESVVEFFPSIINAESLRTTLGKASALILIAGLAGEIITQVNANNLNAKVVAILNGNAEDAKMRAAQSQQDAEQARLEQEKLKAQLAWRSLTPEIAAQMTSRLSTSKHSVILAYVSNDPEALWLAIQFSKIFDAAKWKVIPQSRTYAGRLVFGISVSGRANTATSLLRRVLSESGVPFSTNKIPPPEMSIGDPNTKADVTLMVGSKAPPF